MYPSTDDQISPLTKWQFFIEQRIIDLSPDNHCALCYRSLCLGNQRRNRAAVYLWFIISFCTVVGFRLRFQLLSSILLSLPGSLILIGSSCWHSHCQFWFTGLWIKRSVVRGNRIRLRRVQIHAWHFPLEFIDKIFACEQPKRRSPLIVLFYSVFRDIEREIYRSDNRKLKDLSSPATADIFGECWRQFDSPLHSRWGSTDGDKCTGGCFIALKLTH